MSGFKTWLRGQVHRHDPVGDFARDASAPRLERFEPRWPGGSARLATLHDYLDQMNASLDAHDALDRAWIEWRVGA